MGLQVDEHLSPSLMRKSVHLATKLPSFQSAQESIAETLEVELTTKRVERLTERVGQSRIAEREAAIRDWEARPLMEKLEPPRGVKPPEVVSVECDGGRMQRCDLPEEATSWWCETKVGILLELDSEESETDPCPELPRVFEDVVAMGELTREVHRLASEKKSVPKGEVFESSGEGLEEEPSRRSAAWEQASEEGPTAYSPPRVVSREVTATLGPSDQLGRQLSVLVWLWGFVTGARKAFVSDGGGWNWSIWEKHFKHLGFVPILDFIHALTYVYAAALAGQSREAGARVYRRWIRWVWQGQVAKVIVEVAARAEELGPPPENASETDPRRIVQRTLTYLVNQQSRMNYPEYRRLGLPITSSHMESTVKQINQRVKGSEKFWSREGGEALLQLRADQLSDSDPLALYWLRRFRTATGTRSYARTA